MQFDLEKLEELPAYEPSRVKLIANNRQGARPRGYEDNLERMMEARFGRKREEQPAHR